uniref:CSON004167 protein n=1 Tax=Culicoides sonorensis TaxID=179676 RepID=A0A336LED7_CULSO
MLPSTGLFREILCPFFADDQCTRPFCHFKHGRKDDIETTESSKPKYCPTPLAYQPDDHEESKRKKPKLEYIPLPTLRTRAEYKPQVVEPEEESSGEDPPMSPIEDEPVAEEIEAADDEKVEKGENSSQGDTLTKSEGVSTSKNEDVEKIVENDSQNKENVAQKEDKATSQDENHKPVNGVLTSNDKDKEKSSKSSSHRRSSGDHDRHKHKKSSSSHKSSRSDKNSSSSHHKSSTKDKNKDKEHKSSSSSNKTASSSSSKHKSSSSSRHHSDSKSSKSSSHSSSSRSKSKHKDKDKDRDSKKEREKDPEKSKNEKKTEEIDVKSPEIDISMMSDVEVSSDEDAVMEQCKAIFEEYKPESNGVQEKVEKVSQPPTNELEPDLDTSSKKRVAYEGAVSPLIKVPARNKAVSTMQQIYQRQESIRKMLEEKQSSVSKTTHVNQSSASMLPPVKGRPSITPVSNMLAFRYAKEKIEALRQQRNPIPSTSSQQPSTSTIAQTASKFYGRQAHINKIDPDARPAPPVLEPTSTKISYNLRMQYYTMMVKHCLVIYPNCEDAWARAQTEELAVLKKCNTPNIYKSSSLLAVNKLRKEAIAAGNINTEKNKTVSHDVILAGKQGQNTSWCVNKKLKTDKNQSIGNFDIMPGEKAYNLVLECIATEEQLRQYGFPRPSSKPGKAKMYKPQPPLPPNRENERYCARCSKVFHLDKYDEICIDECNYHPKSAGFRRGSADNFHYCCQLPAGSPGCKYGNYHVTDYMDYENLTGFVRTMAKDEDYTPTKRDIFAFDCEMCYTRTGLELTRITVVNFDEKVVYDSFVKPESEVVDYNTTYSGITAETLENVKTTIREVQAVLLSMFHADTILVGHSLDSDMKAVKLLHDKVVDTSILYPHKMGFPKRRALKTLCIENLKKIIQEDDAGHDSAEDAVVCIQLIKHYLRNRIV